MRISEPKQRKLDSNLIIAVKQSKIQLVELFLNNGAKLEARDEQGQTPLIIAARKGNLKIAKMLLDRGAELEAKDTKGNKALDHAEKQLYIEMIDLLLKDSNQGRAIESQAVDIRHLIAAIQDKKSIKEIKKLASEQN